jgi:hypothetical protein
MASLILDVKKGIQWRPLENPSLVLLRVHAHACVYVYVCVCVCVCACACVHVCSEQQTVWTGDSTRL